MEVIDGDVGPSDRCEARWDGATLLSHAHAQELPYRPP